MATIYYQKKRLRKEARERYQNHSEEEKNKRQTKARDGYQNLSKKKKKKKSVSIIVSVIRIFLRNKNTS